MLFSSNVYMTKSSFFDCCWFLAIITSDTAVASLDVTGGISYLAIKFAPMALDLS